MPKKTLTDRALRALKPAAPGKRYMITDAIVPGLAVRVTDKGQRTFVLASRFPGSGNFTRREIGKYGAITLEAARETARTWVGLIDQGVDPREDKERQRREAQRRRANSFRSVAEDFFRLQVIGPDPARPLERKGPETKRDIENEFVKRWGPRPITEITWDDVREVLDEAVARGAKYQAHNLLGHIRRLFNWAIARGAYGLENSPCDRKRPKAVIGKKLSRKRVLSNAELRAFWRATDAIGYPYGPLFRMLAFTIQRKSQVADAQRPEFDREQKLWIIPAARMKGDEEDAAPHVVPLTADVITILETLPEFKKGKHLFSTTFGEMPVNGFSKAKARLDRLMLAELRSEFEARGEDPENVQLEPWVIHDLRRTGRTGLSALPIPENVRELVLAHAKPGLHKVYDQFAYLEEKRQALELWAARLRSIVEPAPANVIKLPARA
jgi:hypothetical protein